MTDDEFKAAVAALSPAALEAYLQEVIRFLLAGPEEARRDARVSLGLRPETVAPGLARED
jgi:hypothetical protein